AHPRFAGDIAGDALHPGDHGVDIALDEVAKRAGVGIATLYRHFPTREALITGAYVREVERFCDGVEDLLAKMPADQALITWMQRITGYVAGKPGMSLALKSIVMSTDAVALEASHERIFAAVRLLVTAGVDSGVIRSDVLPEDVAGALSGISLTTGQPGSRERANRLVVLFVDGLRHGAPNADQSSGTL
ncbi:MAG TPA: TetR/AcrR family transcriptional regulator, partial [Kribbella sp.]|uniref:TetR/AcrR family transcriptional regulator n=1 Tax=Kribbella sp. TaxID=1871183 RepID=UPI002D79F8F5